MADITAKRTDSGDIIAEGMPWGSGTLRLNLSGEDARTLAHAILDADRHDLEAPALARVEIIDVAEHARQLYGGQEGADRVAAPRTVPEHDYRFQGTTPAGRQTCYHDEATAAHIMAALARDAEAVA